jgi:hypothetical protein
MSSCSWVLHVEQKRPMMDPFLPPVLVNVVMEYLMDDSEEETYEKIKTSMECWTQIISRTNLSVYMQSLQQNPTKSISVNDAQRSINYVSLVIKILALLRDESLILSYSK